MLKEIGSLDGKPRARRRRTRGDRDDRSSLAVRSKGKRGRGVYSSSSSDGDKGRKSKVARKGQGNEVVSGNLDGLESEGNKGVSGEEDIDSMSDWVEGESDEPIGVGQRVGSSSQGPTIPGCRGRPREVKVRGQLG